MSGSANDSALVWANVVMGSLHGCEVVYRGVEGGLAAVTRNIKDIRVNKTTDTLGSDLGKVLSAKLTVNENIAKTQESPEDLWDRDSKEEEPSERGP